MGQYTLRTRSGGADSDSGSNITYYRGHESLVKIRGLTQTQNPGMSTSLPLLRNLLGRAAGVTCGPCKKFSCDLLSSTCKNWLLFFMHQRACGSPMNLWTLIESLPHGVADPAETRPRQTMPSLVGRTVGRRGPKNGDAEAMHTRPV